MATENLWCGHNSIAFALFSTYHFLCFNMPERTLSTKGKTHSSTTVTE